MHLTATLALVIWSGLGSALFLVSAAAASFELPPSLQGINLPDCQAKLERQGGGWCELRLAGKHPSISSAWPRKLDNKTRMTIGPRAVLQAWNGAAFDEASNLFYFMGGGHGDYGGNEVYEFDLETGQWDRLTDPSPLSFLYQARGATQTKPARYCWAPDMRQVPGSAHTYDGLIFSSKTKTIFLLMAGTADGACFDDKKGQYVGDPRILFRDRGAGIYEFNPAREDIRNGLAPLTWRRLTLPQGFRLTYPRSLELPDGIMMVGSKGTLYRFDPTSGTVGKNTGKIADYGDGVAEYHSPGLVLSLHRKRLLLRNLKTGKIEKIHVPGFHGRSLAVDQSGIIFSWDGKQKILTMDLSATERTWLLYDWKGAGPPTGGRRVYSKWQYIAAHDVFVGLSTHKTGVWVYKHPAEMPGIAITKTNP